MNLKYFTNIKNDVLNNDNLSSCANGVKELYCLIRYDLAILLRKLPLNPNTKTKAMKYANRLMKCDYSKHQTN